MDCPGGGIGIRGRLRTCALLGVLVRVQSGAYECAQKLSLIKQRASFPERGFLFGNGVSDRVTD